MAKFFDLEKSRKLGFFKSFFPVIVLNIFLVGVIIILYLIFLIKLYTEISFSLWLGVVMVIPLFFIPVLLHRFGNNIADLWGLNALRKELEKLPDEYCVFQNIILPVSYVNLDFIVVGPTGIHTIGLKNNYLGRLYTWKDRLKFNAVDFSADILKKAGEEAYSLNNYIQKKTGEDIPISPMVVFPSSLVKVSFFLAPHRFAYVLNQSQLVKSILAFPLYPFKTERKVIEDVLKALL